jgi:ABC-type branched-subunit amino acid transport system substrate-binding protein
MMRIKENNKMGKVKWLAALAVVAVLAAACSSNSSSPTTTAGSSSSGSGSSGSGGTKTYTVGILTDLTGPAASGNQTSPMGVQAGAVIAKKDGYTIKYVVADTATSPSGALTGAQKLVEQDHVFAVVAVSSLAFSAAPYLTSKGVPVVGVAEDGPEWITSKNMFSVYGPLDLTKVATTSGQFFKMEGVTNVAALGYSVSPSSSEAAKAAGASAEHAGLKNGYLNAAFPFGSTNVAPVALAMKSAGVDGLTTQTDPNTAFALIAALRQAGANPKVALLPTGYGGDLQQAGPNALQEAQNVYFLSSFEPIEMHTAATGQFQDALKAVGINHDPTYAEYAGYTSVLLLVQGLQAAGSNPSQAGLIHGLSGITDFTAGGLFGSHHLDLSQRSNDVVGVDNCYWITKLSGSTFDLVSNADPICGTVIPGKTVSASS